MITNRGLIMGTGAAASAVFGYAYGVEEFVLVSIAVLTAFVAGAIVVSSRAMAARRALGVVVRLPGYVRVGGSAAAELIVSNSGRRAISPLLVGDPSRHWSLTHPGLFAAREQEPADRMERRRLVGLFSESRLMGDPLRLPGLARGERMPVQIAIPTSARGLVSLTALGIWCEDPFRLLAVKVAVVPATHLPVCPVPDVLTEALDRSVSGLGERPTEATRDERSSPSHAGYEFRSLREYVPGDRMTRLHWPAFARSGELAVRDFVEPAAGCVTILVDVRPSVHRAGRRAGQDAANSSGGADRHVSSGDAGSLEPVISRAAGVGARALADGRLVELCTSAGERLEIAPGPDAFYRLTSALAVLGPSAPALSRSMRWATEPNSAAVWSAANYGRADVVLLTTRAGTKGAMPDRLASRARTEIVENGESRERR